MRKTLKAAPKAQSRVTPNCCWMRLPMRTTRPAPKRSATTKVPMAGMKTRTLPAKSPG